MKTKSTKVLMTGDYWHSDFRAVLASMDCVTTLVPTEKLSDDHLSDATLDLMVLAASRRDQFPHEWVESIRGRVSPTPLVALLGTWCEGEQRSGEFWPGIQRVYWHQWQSRFAYFVQQLREDQPCDWQLPATANQADSVKNADRTFTYRTAALNLVIGVSAVSDINYQMINDASRTVAAKTIWLEGHHWDAPFKEPLSLVVLDADSWNRDVQARIRQLRSFLDNNTPIILMLNFPRQSDLPALNAIGISEVVSKPFQLSDFALAIQRAANLSDSLFAN